MRITEYYVVESDKREVLIREVKELIEKGWQPLGGVVAVKSFLLQTLVKYAEID